jgi:hypothetical protein
MIDAGRSKGAGFAASSADNTLEGLKLRLCQSWLDWRLNTATP